MTAKEIEAAALSDPDAQTLTDYDLSQLKPMSQVKTIRRAMGCTQEEFASR